MKPRTEQLDLLAPLSGIQLRDEGMARAIEHADRVEPAWGKQAADWVLRYSLRNSEFTTEAVREFAERSGFATPTDKRAWGAVVVGLAKRGAIRRKGYTHAKSPTVHNMVVTLWARP